MNTHVVTGASSGIGRAVAAELAGRGERVVAVARTAPALEELRQASGPQLVPVAADVTTAEGRRLVVAALAPDATVVMGLVHAAGSLVVPEGYASLDVAELAAHFETHVGAPIALNQALSAGHDVQRIVYLDSYSASELRVGWSAYSITKAAAQMAARSAEAELSDSKVIRVFPGAVNTPLVQSVLDSDPSPTRQAFRGLAEQGAVAEPADVARFIVDLVLDAPDDAIDSQATWIYEPGE